MSGFPSASELEAAIILDPDDLELRRVYADALQEAGDPRGEHIALAFSAAAGDGEAATKVRAFEREASRRLRSRLDDDYVVRLTWQLGFVTHVDIDAREDPDKFPRAKLRELLEQRELVAVRGLDLRGIWNRAWSPERQLGLLPALVEGRPIRFLGIGDGPITGEHVTALRAALPRLTGLGLLTSKPRSAATALRGLRTVELGARDLRSSKLLALVLEAVSPELEGLCLYGLDERITADAFAPVLRCEVLPELRRLGLFGPHGLTWDLLRALVGSPRARTLESFGFCAAEISEDDESESWFIEHARALAHVRLFTSHEWPDEEDGVESSHLGSLLHDVGRDADAVAEIAHHLQFAGTDVDHYNCWGQLGTAMVGAGWAEEALLEVDGAIRAFGNKVDHASAETFGVKIAALDALGRWEAARELCVRVLDHDADHSPTHRFHGRALRELGRYNEALDAFALAVRHSLYEDDKSIPGLAFVEQGLTLWQLRRYGDALATFAKARLRGDRTSQQQAWWMEGRIHDQRGDLARALAALERAAALVDPNDLKSPLYELGEVLYELGRYEDALAAWRRGAAMFPEWVDVEEQGHALIALGRLDEALATVETARRNSGVARALILHALGRTDEALAAIDDLAHRPGMRERSKKRGKPEPVCVARHAAGSLLEGAFLRASGREDAARERFARVLQPATHPETLHALLADELGGAPACHAAACGRPAAVAALAAALAIGELDDARARADVLAAVIEGGSARLVTMRLWDIRGALPLLGVDTALAARAADAVERGTGDGLDRSSNRPR